MILMHTTDAFVRNFKHRNLVRRFDHPKSLRVCMKSYVSLSFDVGAILMVHLQTLQSEVRSIQSPDSHILN